MDIKAGVEEYFRTHGFIATYVRNYASDNTARMPNALYCEFDTTMQPQTMHSDAGGWTVIMREIDAGRPLLGHFTQGNLSLNPPVPDVEEYFPDADNYQIGDWDGPGDPNGDDTTGEVWNPAAGLGHTMTVVGYWLMPNPIGTDAIVVLDNRDTPPLNDPTQSQRLPIVLPWAGAPWAGLTSVAPASVIYVDRDNASPGADGASWATAYPDLQSALADAAILWPAPEIWVADGKYSPGVIRTDTFQLLSGVGVYGGFNGTETTRDVRDPETNVTILTGDVASNDHLGLRFENNFHVVTGGGADHSALLSGFTITAGNADGPFPDDEGGGMHNTGSGGPTVERCIFLANSSASRGGGMHNQGAALTVVNSKFLGNSTGLMGGGGVYNFTSGSVFINTLFSGNAAPSGNGGGAMRADSAPAPTLMNCTVALNTALGSSGFGGGGGGLAFVNCTPVVVNGIFWDNQDDTGVSEGAQIFKHLAAGTINLNYSCVQNLTGSLGGAGNIADDPKFKNAAGGDNTAGTLDDDMTLKSISPAIDAGDNPGAQCNVSDLAGGDRIKNFTVEMGTYEHTPTVSYADDFEGSTLGEWQFTYSNNGAQSGSICPGNWDTSIDSVTPITGLDSVRLFAEADTQCDPWRIDAAISKNVGCATSLNCLIYFNDIQGSGFNGHSFFQVTAFNAEDLSKSYSIGYSTTSDLGGDQNVTISPGSGIGFAFNFADDYRNKYGIDFPGEVIIRFRASADYAEFDPSLIGTRTTDISIDDLEVWGDIDPCSADDNGDGNVNVTDLLALLANWGACPSPCPGDVNKDGQVNVTDLLALLAAWGACP